MSSALARRTSRRLLHWLALLSACAAPLLAQAQNCRTPSPNTDDDYILGEADGEASAMHWPTGLVWKRCSEGQAFSGGQCTGATASTNWQSWAATYLPKSFTNQANWGVSASVSQNLLVSGAWRMAYEKELKKITEGCGMGPKINRAVFPNTPESSYVWSGSPLAVGASYARVVDFYSGYAYTDPRYYSSDARLVRAGQPFAALSFSTEDGIAVPGATVTFLAFTLAASDPTGQAWGGARISGDGNPQFQVNGGAWVDKAIVKSGDQIIVRLTAPATGSRYATFTLRSGQTTGTSDYATNGGDEFTAMQETFALFAATVLAVDGTCGSASGPASATAPSGGLLCATGTATPVTGSNGQWAWGCNGSGGGSSTAANACTAPYASQTLSLSASPISITVGGTSALTASSSAGLAVTLAASGGTCSLSGNSATGTAAGTCTITASQAGTGDSGGSRYLPATNATVGITVNPAPVNGACDNVAASATAPSASLCATGTATSVTGSGGQWRWGCNGSNGGSSTAANACAAPYASQTLSLSASPTAITVGSTSALTASSSAGLAVTLTHSGSCTLSGNSATGTAAGTCTITASHTGTGDSGVSRYLAATDKTATITVNLPTRAVTASANPPAGGSATCTPTTVTDGGMANCTATASAGYRFTAWTGACASQGATCTLANVTAAQASVALFAQNTLTVPEGPQAGQPLTVDAQPANGWQLTQASTQTVASLNAPALPAGVTLPHGVVRLRLELGAQGSEAQVVLTYPEALPPGSVYWKYGPTQDNAQPHWYRFAGARIEGNRVTLTLSDGGAGDGDLQKNGAIDDPGGVGNAGGAQAIPTLSEWGLLLLTLLAALAAVPGLRRLRAKTASSA